MKRVLILGSNGMAGHVISLYLRENSNYEVIDSCRHPVSCDGVLLDVSDFSKLEVVVAEYKPQIVINAVGVLVKASMDNIVNAIKINSLLPHVLARLGRNYDFKLIHLSTDCVFSGHGNGSYKDTDFCDGDNVYSRTKTLGEVNNEVDLTLRTSIIGPEIKDGTGLFHWFYQQHGNINGYTQAFWSGVTTVELAKVIHLAIEQNLTGLFQLSMTDKISKFDLLKLFCQIWNRSDIAVVPDNNYHCDKSMVMSERAFDYTPPANYQIMLESMRQWMDEHRKIYSQYYY